MTAAAAIPAIRTAPGDKLFPAETAAPVAAIAGFYRNCRFIYKHVSTHILFVFL
jgi:hypothetical protein